MCQLTLVSTNNQDITRNLFYSLLLANSTQNRDGTGIYDPTSNTYWKTEKCAEVIEIELAKQLATVKSETIVGHVRSASLTGFARIITAEKAHPFISEDFILFHNGSLERKARTWSKDEESLIDSEVFLLQLQENYKKEHNIVKLLQTTMSQFCGKFAFIIIYKGSIFVIRGKTAELHQNNITSNGERIGISINTGSVSGEKGLFKGCSYTLLNSMPVGFTKLEELEKESIYLFQPKTKSLEKIGELKEEDKPISKVISTYGSSWTTPNTVTEKASKRIFEYMISLNLNLEEMNNLIDKTIGCGILQLGIEDYDLLFSYLEEFKKRKDTNSKAYPLWKEIKNITNEFYINNYEKLDVQFPYFLDQNLNAILARSRLEAKDRKDLTII